MNQQEATELYEHRTAVVDRRRAPRRKEDTLASLTESAEWATKIAIYDALDWKVIDQVTAFFMEDCEDTGACDDPTEGYGKTYVAVAAMRSTILRAAAGQ